MRSLLALGAALAASASLAVSNTPGAAACSSGRVPGVRAGQFLLATAGRDTVRTGSGLIEYTAPDELGRDPATAHGQVFRLERAGGDLPDELRSATPGTEVILVPYGTMCGDRWRWWESARWAEPGSQRFAPVRLWPRELWIGGRPTFDVAPDYDAYPSDARDPGEGVPVMSAAEVFEMESSLPTREERERTPFAAYQRFLGWAERHPELLTRWPAEVAVEMALDAVAPCTPLDPHPVAGTYRATVVLDGRDTVNAMLRTDARGYPACAPAPLPRGLTAQRPRMADSVKLYVRQGRDEAALEGAGWEGSEGSCGNIGLDVATAAEAGADGRRIWPASLELHLGGCFPGVPAAARIGDVVWAVFQRGTTEGAFYEGANGQMTFRQRWTMEGRMVMEATLIRTDLRTTPSLAR